MDATYLLPSARSIISIMLPFDGRIIRDYLGKIDHGGFQHHETNIYRQLYTIGRDIADVLQQEGFQAVVAEPNLDYRFKDTPEYKRVPFKVKQAMLDWFASDAPFYIRPMKKRVAPYLIYHGMKSTNWNLVPSFSHRYGAVAAGTGHLGWSGNVLHPDYGARVLYNTVITDCELTSDPMIRENPCDGCRICARACQSRFIHLKDRDEINIGGRSFVHNKKAHNLRCIFVCAGFSGQNEDKRWSTWSPGRVDLPASDRDLSRFWKTFAREKFYYKNYYAKVFSDLNTHTEFGFIRKKEDRFLSTCGNCQLVCWKTLSERRENFEILTNSGEVVEGPDFSFKVRKA